MFLRTLPLLSDTSAAAIVTGCGDGSLGGSITVNGKTSGVDSCTFGKGPAGNYREVRAKDGARLRISESKTSDSKTVTLIQVAPSGGQFVDVKCGSSATSHSNLFGKVSGKANLGSCLGPSIAASTELTYAKCTEAK